MHSFKIDCIGNKISKSQNPLKNILPALLGLSSLAIALPILETLGEGATFFVVHAAKNTDIVLFALCVYLLPAAVLFGIIYLASLVNSTLSKWFACAAAGVLAALWALSLMSSLTLYWALAGTIVVGFLVGLGVYYHSGFRSLLGILGYASPVILLNFLLLTPANKMLSVSSEFESSSASGITTPIAMLVLDELPLAALLNAEQTIDAERFPNFARLKEMSTWYYDTTTASAFTDKAVPAILTGLHTDASDKKIPIYSDYPLNFFSMLGSSHNIKAYESSTNLCPEAICGASGGSGQKGFDASAMYRDAVFVWLHAVAPTAFTSRYLSPITQNWRDFGFSEEAVSNDRAGEGMRVLLRGMQQDQLVRTSKFISRLERIDRANIAYLHLSLPHHPWVYLPDGTTYNGLHTPGESSNHLRWGETQCLIDQAALRFGLQLEYVDLLLGDILDALEQSGRANDTMIIVVADHGLAIAPGAERRQPEAATLADVARVPLFIKYANQTEGVRDDRKVQTVDILPTVLDVLGLPPINGLNGQSLVSDDWVEPVRKIAEATEISDIEASMDMEAAIHRFIDVFAAEKFATDSVANNGARNASKRSDKPAANSDPVLTLDRPELYSQISRDSKFLPARLTGRVAEVPTGTEIVISLNGVIAGNSCTYDESGRLSVLLDSAHFREGNNTVEAYTLNSGILHKIVTSGGETDNWRLTRREGGVNVSNNKGDSYAQTKGLSGELKFGTRKGINRIFGWAYDNEFDRAPHTVLLVVEDTIVSSGFRRYRRPNMVKASGAPSNPREAEYWFTLDMESELLEKRKQSLSVIALFDQGRLVELVASGTDHR